MTTDEQTNPDQTETWEPDWEQIKQARHTVTLVRGFYGQTVSEMAEDIDRAVITEYRRQRAENGKVEVDREDLRLLRDAWRELSYHYSAEADLHDMLADDPGGYKGLTAYRHANQILGEPDTEGE